MAQHRNSTTIHIRPQDHPLLSRCRNDSSLRVMVFCATANYGTQDIAFPHQSELKVNGDEIKANLRGLKNKPGSTRPADITDWLRLKLPHYVNNVDFTYALTTKAGDKASQTISQVRRDLSSSCLGAFSSRIQRSRLTVIVLCSRGTILSSTSAKRHPWTVSCGLLARARFPRLPSWPNVS